MKHQQKRIVLDGQQMVAVPVEQFDSLLALRRQVGAQNARIQSLRRVLVELTAFLESLDADWEGDAAHGGGSDHRTSGLVAELRGHIRNARALIPPKRFRGGGDGRERGSG